MNNLPLTMFNSGNKAVVIDPTDGIAIYSSAGAYGNVSNRLNFINSTDLNTSGVIAAPHDTNYFRIYATKGLLELSSQYVYGGSPGSMAKILVDGQGASAITTNSFTLRLQAGSAYTYKELLLTSSTATIDGYSIWTTSTLTNPVQVGGLYSYIRLDYLQTNAIRGSGVSFLNTAGSAYEDIAVSQAYLNNAKLTAPMHVSLRNTSDSAYVGAIGSLFYTTDGYILSDNIIKLMTSPATAYQRLSVGQITSYIPGTTSWTGGISGDANGAGYNYFDFNYAGVRSGYLLWDATTIRITADGSKYVVLSGTRIGINRTSPEYVFDVSGEGRITGTLRTDIAYSLRPQGGAPGASAVYGILYVNSSHQLRYIRPGGGDYYVAG